MKPALRISLNVLNALVLPFGVLIAHEAFGAYSAQLAFPKWTSHGQKLEYMYCTSAFFGLLVTTVGIMGAFLVNIDALILRTLYSIILGVMALIFVVLWILNHELMDEYTDDMVFKVYEATLNYRQPEHKEFLDKVHRYARCCGSRGVHHFRNQSYLPSSCCPDRNGTKGAPLVDTLATNNCTNATAYKHTCEVRATRRIVKRVFQLTTTMLVLTGFFTFIITLEMWF